MAHLEGEMDFLSCSLAPVCVFVQVRMQSEGKLAPGAPRKYPSAFKAYGIIVRWAVTVWGLGSGACLVYHVSSSILTLSLPCVLPLTM